MLARPFKNNVKPDTHSFENRVDPDKLASDEAN